MALARSGPGLLLRDVLRDDDPRLAAIAGVLAEVAPDILLLQGVDHDHELMTLAALRDRIAREGPRYPHLFALRPNSGWPTGLDMDGDGRRGGPGDAQGYGAFSGQGGMALLSRHPIDTGAARDWSALLWRDLPGALLPEVDGRPFPSEEAQAIQRLSSVGHWAVPVTLPGGRLTILAFHAAPPVFDGPEDRNGRRNADEIRLWQHILDGGLGPAPDHSFVIAGVANLDPERGEGRHEAIRALLSDSRVQDPRPMRPGAMFRFETAHWPQAGALRVSYLLPSAGLTVSGAGIYWPEGGDAGAAVATLAGPHRLIWVDLSLD
ncbi:MAG: endonuclease/exonuclease/phosphatase family protein [Roseovarius sp.]|nr:endonuclease/exonuclease/phosphatase family protein [Roseovarius sp.]